MAPAAFKITARVNTRNEEDNIAAALESLLWADEIVVVDAHSTDNTVAVARRYTDKVVRHEFAGFGEQHSFADSICSHEWVFWLDADERLTPAARDAILALRQAGTDLDAFRLARRTWYLDRWIRHSGWYPDYQPRLYRRSRTRWLGEAPHAAPKVEGRMGTLPGDLLHFTRRNMREHIEVMNFYTDLAADARFAARRKASWSRLWLAPAATFWRSYVLKQGFRDGRAGLIIAWLAAAYVVTKEAKLYEHYRGRRAPDAPADPAAPLLSASAPSTSPTPRDQTEIQQ